MCDIEIAQWHGSLQNAQLHKLRATVEKHVAQQQFTEAISDTDSDISLCWLVSANIHQALTFSCNVICLFY